MTSQEIRQSFLDYFKGKEHRIVPSASVIPHGDPTLLFTNAGMNQFKDVFLGQGTRDFTRATDTQKCIRVSGKHNDLEEVGVDTYHHTFFEMLGNWSFGDYYKEEAIDWAWELLTEVWGLDKERLYATVFRTDDEAYELWKKHLPEERIKRFDEKDNFWEMGDTGPCGPCSEIHYDNTPDLSGGPLVNAGVPEVIEIWNLVFIQYNRQSDGSLEELSAKHVDTGMGFERICAVIQKKSSNYDTDVFSPIITELEKLSGKKYSRDLDDPDGIAMRVIADHIRTLSFAIADGALPGNEGRGYVLRRILRRGSRFARNLGFTEPIIYKLLPILVNTMGNVFPELVKQQKTIEKVILGEEMSFLRTLERGLEKFEAITMPFIEQFSVTLREIRDADESAEDSLKIQAKRTDDYLKSAFNRTAGIFDIEKKKSLNDISNYIENHLSEINKTQEMTKSSFGPQLFNTLKQLITKVDEKFSLDIDDVLINIFQPILGKIESTQGKSSAENYLSDIKAEVDSQISKTVKIIEKSVNKVKNKLERIGNKISGNDAFLLYDTFGFPLDLTELLAREMGLKVDIEEFDLRMKEQRERSRKARKKTEIKIELPEFDGETKFVGYDTLTCESEILFIQKNQVIVKETPFYTESGGQVADTGKIIIAGEEYFVSEAKRSGNAIVHVCDRDVENLVGSSALLVVDKDRRSDIMRNHSATHLFHEALRTVLGDHVQQQGSLVAPDYLRFDFNHFAKLTDEEIAKIERLVNNKIFESIDVRTSVLNIEEAQRNPKIKMFFGDKYGEVVRAVVMDENYSQELCGGTHVANTSEIAMFKIISESSIAAGVRRVEAVTGKGVYNYIYDLKNKISHKQNESSALLEKIKQLEKEISSFKLSEASSGIESLVDNAKKIGNIRVSTGKIEAENVDALRNLAENLRDEFGKNGIGLLAMVSNGKVQLVCVVTDDLKKHLPAGKLVGAAAKLLGGGGGGKPHMATAGGKDIDALPTLLENDFYQIVKDMM